MDKQTYDKSPCFRGEVLNVAMNESPNKGVRSETSKGVRSETRFEADNARESNIRAMTIEHVNAIMLLKSWQFSCIHEVSQQSIAASLPRPDYKKLTMFLPCSIQLK